MVNLSVDQFVALEVWLEKLASRNSSGPGVGPAAVHAARQRAFSLLTGINAPLPQDSEGRLAMADAVVEGVDPKRRIGPKPRPPADHSDLA